VRILLLVTIAAALASGLAAGAKASPNSRASDGHSVAIARMVQLAESKIGTVALGRNSDKGGFIDTQVEAPFGFRGKPWCAMFVSWAARAAGVRFYSANAVGRGVKPFMLYGASVARIYDWARNAGLARGRKYVPRAGDLVIFDSPATPSRYDHIGIVVEPASGGVIHVVAGDNTNPQRPRGHRGVFETTDHTDSRVLVGYVALSAARDVG
jgi:CHAP domain